MARTFRRASKPRDIGFNTEAMNMPVNSDVKLAVCRYEQRKVARRMFSVFDQLATNGKTVNYVVYPPTLSKEMAVTGNNMFGLYAVWKGYGGKPDREDVGFVQGARSAPELLTDRMIKAGAEYMAIASRMDADRAKLLTAICHDMVFSDGAMIITEKSPEIEWVDIVKQRRAMPGEPADENGKVNFIVQRPKPRAMTPKVRWREVVRVVAGINDRDCQRDAIKRMCIDLVKALDEARKSGDVIISI